MLQTWGLDSTAAVTASYDLATNISVLQRRGYFLNNSVIIKSARKSCSTDLFMLENSVNRKMLITEIISHPMQQI
jgi:hypothetical protein